MARKPSAAESQLKRDYFDYLEAMESRALEATNGVWYNRLGAAKHADGQLSQWDLFRCPMAHVERYMSEELLEFLSTESRLSFTEYREQIREFNREQYLDYLESVA